MNGEVITVRGQVQGVGFRPAVWRIATELGLTGDVRNTGDGVEIRLFGEDLNAFAQRLELESPALASIDVLERRPLDEPAPADFTIAPSDAGAMRGAITPDVVTCADCLAETRDPFERRYRYPFTNCTNCGPRFSIVESAPYDRARTSMKSFGLCESCAAEYSDPSDRRFHAQPVACHSCGPRAWIERLGEGAVHHEIFSMMDDVDAAGGMLMNGHIVAVKGIGGFHLACDATKGEVVQDLRDRKRRPHKAFALMARDLDVIKAYCAVSPEEEALLRDPAGPIVLLKKEGAELPDAVAPGLERLGFMLPCTPMHHLMLRRMTRPVVMTSGNVSGDPQCITNDEARARLGGVAEFALMHNREIANRIDDSVARIDLGETRLLRRARGYAPAPLPLPDGFEARTPVLALGAELKNTFCLVKDGQAVVSQHMGDLENLATSDDVARNLALYRDLYEFEPGLIAVDRHPDYLSTKNGKDWAARERLPLVEIQHHHAHIAACMGENGWALEAGPVLGVALDGLGLGDDGEIWGGEFLACTYRGYQRLGALKPVPLPGGAAAVREPWRNAYAHLTAEMGWTEFKMNFSDLPVFEKLDAAPRATLDAMIKNRINAPLSSSCGRLFDAAAALCGLAWDRQSYEGQAAMLFEAALEPAALEEPDHMAYPFALPLMQATGMPYIEPLGAWRALLGDLYVGTDVGVISARFHRGLAKAIIAMVDRLSGPDQAYPTVALTGGCFQNRVLFDLVHIALSSKGYDVLSHKKLPANDGGISYGQALIALAAHQSERTGSCA